jgi:hypothetical protein
MFRLLLVLKNSAQLQILVFVVFYSCLFHPIPAALFTFYHQLTKQLYVLTVLDNYIQMHFMGVLRQIAEYLYLKKRDPNAPHTPWMKYMHGINRISIMLFLFAMVVIILRLLFKK